MCVLTESNVNKFSACLIIKINKIIILFLNIYFFYLSWLQVSGDELIYSMNLFYEFYELWIMNLCLTENMEKPQSEQIDHVALSYGYGNKKKQKNCSSSSSVILNH